MEKDGRLSSGQRPKGRATFATLRPLITQGWSPIRLAALLLPLALFCGAARSESLPPARASAPCVVLVHGLGGGAWSMTGLARVLRADGWKVINVSYPSTRVSVADAANVWLDRALRAAAPDPAARISFVTHSMGGIVVRQYLASHRLQNLGRVVMLGPPNQGSPLADQLKDNRLYKLILGPAGQELGAGSADVPRRLGAVDFDLGVIAGDRSIQPFFPASFHGPNDGIVPVENTRVEGMREILVVHHSHFFLPWSKEVQKAVLRFLDQGSFAPGTTQLPSGGRAGGQTLTEAVCNHPTCLNSGKSFALR